MKFFLPSLLLLPSMVAGHAVLIYPKSRQYYAHTDGKGEWQQRDGPLGVPAPEYNQNGQQAGGYEYGPCGKLRADRGRSYTWEYFDVFGNPVPWKTQATLEEGGEVEIHVEISANHWGHFEFRLCTDTDNPTQECFDENILMFSQDLMDESPFDASYPERGYINPGADLVQHKYSLPYGITGKVLLQWQWITDLGCSPKDYDKVIWPDSWGIGSWWGDMCEDRFPDAYDPVTGNLLPSSGDTPQHYWQCSEIEITPADGSPPETPQPVEPTPQPIDQTPQPVDVSTPQPVDGSTPQPVDPTPQPIDPTPQPVEASTPQPAGSGSGIPFPCCGWNGSCEQADNEWCHFSCDRCTGPCNGVYYEAESQPSSECSDGGDGGSGTAECCTWGGWSVCPDWTLDSTDGCQQSEENCNGCSGTWISSRRRTKTLRGGRKAAM